jgi:hypothetical protein
MGSYQFTGFQYHIGHESLVSFNQISSDERRPFYSIRFGNSVHGVEPIKTGVESEMKGSF